LLPRAIVGDADTDATRREHRHRWSVGSVENSSAVALTDPVERAPLGEAQHLIIGELGERHIEREHALAHGRFPPALVLGGVWKTFTAAAQLASPIELTRAPVSWAQARVDSIKKPALLVADARHQDVRRAHRSYYHRLRMASRGCEWPHRDDFMNAAGDQRVQVIFPQRQRGACLTLVDAKDVDSGDAALVAGNVIESVRSVSRYGRHLRCTSMPSPGETGRSEA